MDRASLKRWTNALESGIYTQGHDGWLRYIDLADGQMKWSAIGVLADVNEMTFTQQYGHIYVLEEPFEPESAQELNQEQLIQVGLTRVQQEILRVMNDHSLLPFHRISGILTQVPTLWSSM